MSIRDDEEDDYLSFFLSKRINLSNKFLDTLEAFCYLDSITTLWEVALTPYDNWIFILYDIPLFEKYESDLKTLQAFAGLQKWKCSPILTRPYFSIPIQCQATLRLNQKSHPYTQALVQLKAELHKHNDLRYQASEKRGGKGRDNNNKDSEENDDVNDDADKEKQDKHKDEESVWYKASSSKEA